MTHSGHADVRASRVGKARGVTGPRLKVTMSWPLGRHLTTIPRQATTSSRQFVEQHPGIFQDRRVEPFGEPTVDRCENIVGLLAFTLITPKLR